MLKKLSLLTLLLLSTIFVLTGCQKTENTVSDNQANQPRTVKAWYISYAPWFIVDPNTKKMSGITYDILEEIAKRKNLKIEYAEEVTWATLVEVLETERVNIIANPVWMTDERKAKANFSNVVYYSPIWTYVRIDETRINTLNDINKPEIKIACLDREWWQVIAKTIFPNATTISFPNSVDVSQMLSEVSAGKEDVTFAEPIFAYEYIKNNPWKLKNIAETDPVQKRWNAFMMKKWDVELTKIINEWIQELISDWTLNKIIDKYEPFPNAIIRVNK